MTIELAEKFEQEENYQEAYDEYKKLLNAKPKNVDLLQRAAHIAGILGKIEEAENYFSKILEIDATNELAYEQLMDIFISSYKHVH